MTFTLAISCLTTSNMPWFMDLTFQVPMQLLLFTALDLASITSHIHNWVLFLLWLHPFILSGVISPLISSSILGTYWPGEFPFQYPIICLFIPFMALGYLFLYNLNAAVLQYWLNSVFTQWILTSYHIGYIKIPKMSDFHKILVSGINRND